MLKRAKQAPVPESPAAIGMATGLGVPHDPVACGQVGRKPGTDRPDLTAVVPGQSGAEGMAPLPDAEPRGARDTR